MTKRYVTYGPGYCGDYDNLQDAIEVVKRNRAGAVYEILDFTRIGGVALEKAMSNCKVRGYIARLSRPDKKYWKNTLYFGNLPEILSIEDRSAHDWEDFDPADNEPPSYLMA